VSPGQAAARGSRPPPATAELRRPRRHGIARIGEEIAVHLESCFDEATDPLDTVLPSVFATVIQTDRTTVLLASDHSRTDGYSIYLAPYEFHEIHAASLTGRYPDRLAEVGSHAELIASGGLYARLWSLQTADDEDLAMLADPV